MDLKKVQVCRRDITAQKLSQKRELSRGGSKNTKKLNLIIVSNEYADDVHKNRRIAIKYIDTGRQAKQLLILCPGN